MDPLLVAILMFSFLFLAIFAGHPLAFALGGVGTAFLLTVSVLLQGMPADIAFALFANSLWRIMSDFVLVAVPLFIFMAQIMESCGVAEKLFGALHLILGPIRGGLAIAVIMVCTVFAASAGVVGATEVAIGLLAVPALVKRGYSPALTAGAVCSGGTLGIIIPPSIMLVFYASLANLSPGQLFAAAVTPGVLLAGLYMLYIAVRCGLQPELGPPMPKEERAISLGRKLRMLSTSLLAPGFLILTVLGTIIAGVATPTEAAGMGCLGALVLMALYRRLTWGALKKACVSTLQTNSMILALAVGGACFQSSFMFLGCGEVISDILTGLELNPKLIVFVMMICIFLLGMVIDWIGILLITVPIFVPVVSQLGFDQVWFATLIAINIQMAFLTPPFGYSLFYLKGIAADYMTMVQIYKGVVPFIIMQWAAMLICFFFEDVILWLPALIFG
jgi:tripartite ATP-independent transporter DctM subunit